MILEAVAFGLTICAYMFNLVPTEHLKSSLASHMTRRLTYGLLDVSLLSYALGRFVLVYHSLASLELKLTKLMLIPSDDYFKFLTNILFVL